MDFVTSIKNTICSQPVRTGGIITARKAPERLLVHVGLKVVVDLGNGTWRSTLELELLITWASLGFAPHITATPLLWKACDVTESGCNGSFHGFLRQELERCADSMKQKEERGDGEKCEEIKEEEGRRS